MTHSRVIINREFAKQAEEAGQGYVHVQTKDGTTYRYGADGTLRRVTPKGGRSKKERRANRDRVKAMQTRIEMRAQATYSVTVKDRIERYCPSCQRSQFIYVMREPNAMVEKTCCTVCSYIIERKTVDGI